MRTRGIDAMREMLKSVDPVSAARISPGDSYRIMRALEVFRQTGKPLSSYTPPDTLRSDLDATVLALSRPREELRVRIEQRVDRMLSCGLYEEISELLRRGYTAADPGLRAIGYRQFFDSTGALRPQDDPETRNDVIRDTRRYAKRQETFFRTIPGLQTIDAEDVATVEERIRFDLGRLSSP